MKLHEYVDRVQRITAIRCPRKIVEKRNKDGKVTQKIPQPWELVDARETESSIDIALWVPIGYSASDLEQELDAIAASFGLFVTLRDRKGIVQLTIAKQDFSDLIAYHPDMLSLTQGREVLVGYTQEGKPLFHNFRVPHVLIGAQSGYGKTDLLRFWLLQLIHRFTPEQLHIDIIDGKGFSFLPFRGVPHIRRIARDLSGAAAILRDAKLTMMKRSDLVWANDDRDMTGGFCWNLVVIDELAMISPSFQVSKGDKKLAMDAYADMAAVACVGREAGVGMIMATQRPDANVVHPQVKQNCDVSIALRCKTQTNSEIILDRSGAEKLPHGKPGRGIYAGMTDVYFQTPFVGSDNVWREILAPYKSEGGTPIERKEEIDDLGDYV